MSNFVRAGHQLPGCPALASYGTAACSPTNLALSWRASAFRLSLDSGCLARRPGRFRGRRTGPPEVLGQVAPGGRLVIPLRVRGSISRSVAFERDGDGPAWRSVSHEMAMFVPLRKSAADDTRARIPVADDGTVTVEGWDEQDIDRDALATVLDAPGAPESRACPGSAPGSPHTSAGAPWPPSEVDVLV